MPPESVEDSVTEQHFFSLSCDLYPHVIATPDFSKTGGSGPRDWVQNLYCEFAHFKSLIVTQVLPLPLHSVVCFFFFICIISCLWFFILGSDLMTDFHALSLPQ